MTNEKILYVAHTPFEAARRVDILESSNPSSRLHGHSFTAKIRAELAHDSIGKNDPLEYLVDLAKSIVRPLDYDLLNNHIEIPTDENIARHIHKQLAIKSINSVGIQSTQNQGADIDKDDNAHIWRKFRFEAAHQLPNVEPGHPCGRMHGHGFEVILHVKQNITDLNLGIEFEELQRAWSPLHDQLHCSCLNHSAGLENPTSEMLAKWIWERLKSKLPTLSCISVFETITAGCHYDGQNYRIWKEQRFESAIATGLNSKSDNTTPLLLGHSYLMRLHLTSPLDEIMGWTIDYGDVKSAFKPTYERMDHHSLHDIPSIEGTDVASILRWIKHQAEDTLPQLDQIDLFETPQRGASIYWGADQPSLLV